MTSTTQRAHKETGGGVARMLLRPASQSTYEKIFGTVYVGLMLNVLLVVACSPVIMALALVRNPLLSWPFFLALSILCAPALAGAFTCFATLDGEGTAVFRPFWAGYRAALRRASPAWAGGAVVVGVLVADALLLGRLEAGPALVPFFVVAAGFTIAIVIGVVVLAVERPRAGFGELVRPCIYLIARRWWLAAVNVLVLALAVAIVLAKPMIGLFLVSSPLLYVVWANTRYILSLTAPLPMIIEDPPRYNTVDPR